MDKLVQHDACLRRHQTVNANVGADEGPERFCIEEILEQLDDVGLRIGDPIVRISAGNEICLPLC
jgi:hypothetical protein